jgi:hypothetical protein
MLTKILDVGASPTAFLSKINFPNDGILHTRNMRSDVVRENV